MSYSSWKLSYQISPITLYGGIAGSNPGGGLPIISLLQPGAFSTGLLSQPDDTILDNYFASWEPVAGSKLIVQEVGKYPFANQSVAANAVIAEPLTISMMMICPVRTEGGYSSKLSVLTGMQNSLAQHNAMGGTYTVLTPSYVYTNCLLTNVEDISAGQDTKQVQYRWRFDFEQPLLTLQQAQAAQNALMTKLSSGTQINGQPQTSGPANSAGQPTSQGLPPGVPAAQGSASSGIIST